MTTRRRRKAWRRGRIAEAAAVWHFRLRGWRVLARDYRTPVGEIDLVVRRGETVAFVEVKARETITAAAEAVTPRQQGRIVRAAESFLKARPDCAGLRVRFDVVMVRPWRLPVHLPDAWRP